MKIPEGRTIDTWFSKPTDPFDKDFLDNVIKLVFDRVLQSGGDGDGNIICKHFYYMHIANHFEEFFKINGFNRFNHEECVIFSRDQENISIIQYEDGKNQAHLFDDITIII